MVEFHVMVLCVLRKHEKLLARIQEHYEYREVVLAPPQGI
jgi:hypothetical protein